MKLQLNETRFNWKSTYFFNHLISPPIWATLSLNGFLLAFVSLIAVYFALVRTNTLQKFGKKLFTFDYDTFKFLFPFNLAIVFIFYGQAIKWENQKKIYRCSALNYDGTIFLRVTMASVSYDFLFENDFDMPERNKSVARTQNVYQFSPKPSVASYLHRQRSIFKCRLSHWWTREMHCASTHRLTITTTTTSTAPIAQQSELRLYTTCRMLCAKHNMKHRNTHTHTLSECGDSRTRYTCTVANAFALFFKEEKANRHDKSQQYAWVI